MGQNATRLQNIYLVARDLPALSTFYDKVLGLPLKVRDGERWAQYNAGGTSFSLSCAEEALPAVQGAVLVFEVADFKGMEQTVAGAGGTVLGVRDMGSHGCVMSVRDSEGNIVQLLRRAATKEGTPHVDPSKQ
jgi:predicted enzyme related to lactoylglutathione lyase